MALHEIPDDGVKHLGGKDCPCGPTARKRRVKGVTRTVYTHHETTAAAPAPVALSDQVTVPADLVDQVAPPADPASGPEASCGHVVVDVDGEWQHHDIPDDGAPHAATTECGCQPQRDTSSGHVVLLHQDQGADVDALYREVFP